MMNYKLKVLIVQILIVVAFLLFWEIGTGMGLINSFIFSSPSKIISTLFSLATSGELFIHIGVTLREIVISFALGIGIGFIVSVVMYLSKFLASTIDPFLTMLNSLPKVALGPIIIIWVGANSRAIITMALLINVIISIITIYNGFIHTDPLKVKLFKSFKASKWQTLTKLIIPSNWNTIVSALKINISMTLIGVIMGEFLVSKKGIGYLIIYGTQLFNFNLVFAGIVILVVISFLLYELVDFIEKRLLNE